MVFIDGKAFREHCLLIALGLDSQGRKHGLGLREGSTENVQVARALLSELVERGLPTERTMLFIIDGAKALRRAIAEVYGELGVVQRCQVHKRHNILGHLPETMHASVARTLRDATGALQKTLRTTNAIENLNSLVENYTRNVKRWRGGSMIQRWVSAALLEAEKQFRRVRGYRDMRHLIRALDARSATPTP